MYVLVSTYLSLPHSPLSPPLSLFFLSLSLSPPLSIHQFHQQQKKKDKSIFLIDNRVWLFFVNDISFLFLFFFFFFASNGETYDKILFTAALDDFCQKKKNQFVNIYKKERNKNNKIFALKHSQSDLFMEEIYSWIILFFNDSHYSVNTKETDLKNRFKN